MRPSTMYLGNLYWRNEDGEKRMEQTFTKDRNDVFVWARELAKSRKSVSLKFVAMHYDRHDVNDYNNLYWFDYKNGKFIDVTNKYR